MTTPIQKAIEESLKGFENEITFRLIDKITKKYETLDSYFLEVTIRKIIKKEIKFPISNILSAIEAEVEGKVKSYKTSNNGREPYDFHGYTHASDDFQAIIKSAKEKIQ